MRVVAAAALASLSILPHARTALAAPASSPTPIHTPFDEDGYSAIENASSKNCLVGANIDVRTMVARVADLQQRGMIRADVDPVHIQTHPWSTATAIALKLQPFLVVNLFKDHPELARCGFVQTITGTDGKQEMGYAFDMTRAAYSKVDWPAYSPRELPDISENFRLGPVTAGHMNAEAAQ